MGSSSADQPGVDQLQRQQRRRTPCPPSRSSPACRPATGVRCACVGPPAGQVDHRPPPSTTTHTAGADLAPLGEVAGELVAHRGEAGVAVAGDRGVHRPDSVGTAVGGASAAPTRRSSARHASARLPREPAQERCPLAEPRDLEALDLPAVVGPAQQPPRPPPTAGPGTTRPPLRRWGRPAGPARPRCRRSAPGRSRPRSPPDTASPPRAARRSPPPARPSERRDRPGRRPRRGSRRCPRAAGGRCRAPARPPPARRRRGAGAPAAPPSAARGRAARRARPGPSGRPSPAASTPTISSTPRSAGAAHMGPFSLAGGDGSRGLPGRTDGAPLRVR